MNISPGLSLSDKVPYGTLDLSMFRFEDLLFYHKYLFYGMNMFSIFEFINKLDLGFECEGGNYKFMIENPDFDYVSYFCESIMMCIENLKTKKELDIAIESIKRERYEYNKKRFVAGLVLEHISFLEHLIGRCEDKITKIEQKEKHEPHRISLIVDNTCLYWNAIYKQDL